MIRAISNKWLECVKKSVKKDGGLFFVVLGAHLRVLTTINVCHFNANFAWTLKLFISVKVEHFYVHVNMAFVLTLTIQFNIWTKSDFSGILWIYVVGNLRQFTYSECKVAYLLWFSHFGIRIGGVAHLLSCSHLVDYTSIPLIFHVNLIGQWYFWRDKTWHFLRITSFNS